jgi:hypothetical protein
VFISYAHDDELHEERVRGFWLFLRGHGVNARLDLPAAEQRVDWPQWMDRELREADWVLVIASPEYKRRAEGDALPGEGRGVQWEGRLIREHLYVNQDEGLRRVLPVVLSGCSADDIPRWLAPASATHYVVNDYTVAGAEKLLRVLTGQPWETEPPLGPVPLLRPRNEDQPETPRPQPALTVPPGTGTSSPTGSLARSGTRFRVGDLNSTDLVRVVAAARQLAERDEVDAAALIRPWETMVEKRAARFVLAQHAEVSAPMLLDAIDAGNMDAADLASPPHGGYLSGPLQDRLARVHGKWGLRASIVAAGRAGVTSAAPRLARLARMDGDYESYSIDALAYLYRSVGGPDQPARRLRESILTELGAVLADARQAGLAFPRLRPVHADALLASWIPSDHELLVRCAANALGGMRLSRARQRLADRAAAAAPQTARNLLINVGRIGGDASVELLLDRLDGPSADAAHEGLLLCVEDASEDNFELVISDLLRKPSPCRWYATLAVGRRKFEPALAQVRKALTSDDLLERGAAALALARITGRHELALLEETRVGATDYSEAVLCAEALLLATRDEDLVREVNNALMASYEVHNFLLDRVLVEDAVDILEIAGGMPGRGLARALEWMTTRPANED